MLYYICTDRAARVAGRAWEDPAGSSPPTAPVFLWFGQVSSVKGIGARVSGMASGGEVTVTDWRV